MPVQKVSFSLEVLARRISAKESAEKPLIAGMNANLLTESDVHALHMAHLFCRLYTTWIS